MTSSEDERFDALIDLVKRVLVDATKRYSAEVREGGNDFPFDEFTAPGIYFDLVPDDSEAARLRLHPEDPGEVTISLDGVVFYTVYKADRDLDRTNGILADLIGGVAEGQVTVEEKTRWLSRPISVVRVVGPSGRAYEGRPGSPLYRTWFRPYHRRGRAE